MSERAFDLGGIGVLAPTPFGKADELNRTALTDYCRLLAESDVSYILVGAATGEGSQLTEAEFALLTSTAVDACGDRLPVTAYVGRPGTAETVQLAREAERAGASALFVVQPPFNRPDPEGIYRHYMAVAGAVDLPVVVYNNPLRTGVDLSIEVVARVIAACPQVVGFKQTDLNELASAFVELGDQCDVIARSEIELPMSIGLGAKGTLSFVAAFWPSVVTELHRLLLTDPEAGLEHYRAAFPLFMAVQTGPPAATVKHLLRRAGVDFGGLRLPLTPPTEGLLGKLDREFERATEAFASLPRLGMYREEVSSENAS